jgi:hypothetical protein
MILMVVVVVVIYKYASAVQNSIMSTGINKTNKSLEVFRPFQNNFFPHVHYNYKYVLEKFCAVLKLTLGLNSSISFGNCLSLSSCSVLYIRDFCAQSLLFK